MLKGFQAVFQSTRPCGTRHFYYYFKEVIFIFQSTRPYGTRLTYTFLQNLIKLNFNPRAPVGRDPLFFLCLQKLPKNFNPRAPVGRDLGGGYLPSPFNISIHAPLWDATSIAI